MMPNYHTIEKHDKMFHDEQSCIVIDDGEYENIHYSMFIKFSSLSNIELIRFKDTGHKVASNLKELNL